LKQSYKTETRRLIYRSRGAYANAEKFVSGEDLEAN